MDKNTIIGALLIGAVLIGFTLFQQSSVSLLPQPQCRGQMMAVRLTTQRTPSL